MSDTEDVVEQPKVAENFEELASQYGWKVEGEKSAQEFIKVAMDKFPDQSKKIKELFKTVDLLKDHMTKNEQAAYDRAKRDLDSQRRQAIKEGDVELVEQLDQHYQELKPQSLAPPEDINSHPSILDFEERNAEWLNDTSFEALKMQKWIQEHGAVLGKKKLPVDKHMQVLEEHLHKEFSNYFESGEDAEVSAVSSSRSTTSTSGANRKKKNHTFNDLSKEQKEAARLFERHGLPMDKYIADLVKQGVL